MPNDKELAEAYRLVKEDWPNASGYTDNVPSVMEKRIDELDPPKPEYPDGLYAWVTYTHQLGDGHPYRALAQYDATDGEWVMELANTGVSCAVTGDHVTKVEPLRVLGDDEIAMRRDVFKGATSSQARKYARDLTDCSCCRHPAAAAVFAAYAGGVDNAQRAEPIDHLCAEIPCRHSTEAGDQ